MATGKRYIVTKLLKHVLAQAPRPLEPWLGVREAKLFGQKCRQVEADSQVGSEDCLHVNVYSPWLQRTHEEASPSDTSALLQRAFR